LFIFVAIPENIAASKVMKNKDAGYFLRNGIFTCSWKSNQGCNSWGRIFWKMSVVLGKLATVAFPSVSNVFTSRLKTEIIIRMTSVNIPEITNLIASTIKL